MRIILCLGLALSLSVPGLAQNPVVDPCTLVEQADVARILGEIKEGPNPKEGLLKEKGCEWTNMSGSWLSVSVASAEQWGLKKGMANSPAALKGLGEEAFSDKRGTTAEIYARKGKWMIEVRTSAGSDAAKKTAALAIQKLP